MWRLRALTVSQAEVSIMPPVHQNNCARRVKKSQWTAETAVTRAQQKDTSDKCMHRSCVTGFFFYQFFGKKTGQNHLVNLLVVNLLLVNFGFFFPSLGKSENPSMILEKKKSPLSMIMEKKLLRVPRSWRKKKYSLHDLGKIKMYFSKILEKNYYVLVPRSWIKNIYKRTIFFIDYYYYYSTTYYRNTLVVIRTV